MKFCRIDLSVVEYESLNPLSAYAEELKNSERYKCMDDILRIYSEYCKYKQFESVMPLFPSQITDCNSDVIAYYADKSKSCMIGWSLIKRHDSYSAEAIQFAWDYKDPSLSLGIESLKFECSFYRRNGFKYLYLGQVADYKSHLLGYEVIGPLND